MYKENEQGYQTAAKRESYEEPLCKGRNQIVIVADNRVPQWASNNTEGNSLLKSFKLRNFQTTTNGTNTTGNFSLATNIGMKAQTVDFKTYYNQVSGSIQSALVNSIVTFIFMISATML